MDNPDRQLILHDMLIVACISTMIIACFMIVTDYGKFKRSQEVDRKLDLIYKEIIDRNKTDSLYHEHLSKCSFIRKEDLSFDSRGYVYSKYHRKTNATWFTK
jgi:hypothetical protein